MRAHANDTVSRAIFDLLAEDDESAAVALLAWLNVETLKATQITPSAIGAWAVRVKNEGTRFKPPGARAVIRGNSATSVNRAVDTLRRLMDIAVEVGAVHSNPVLVKPSQGRLKKKITRTKIELPCAAGLDRVLAAIETNGAKGGWGMEAADFCRFLAFSGCRVGEVALVTWSCVDWPRKLLRVPGTKSDSSDRIVPLFSDLEALLQRVMERRKRAAIYAAGGEPMFAATDKIFRLSECQKSIDAACKRVGVARITHHDFRHLFATRCIESGVDIPTVSRWLGHSDDGAPAMRTYGHLRQEHSQTQAEKVKFMEAR